ncbi:MAG: hypothetical protein WC141_10660 [Arcobacteraceae bacterium]
MNIPIYRAKKVYSDEYVIGWYSDPILIEGKLYLSITNKNGTFRIDTTTLAIHFDDMIDSEGNRIFASLGENGKGGDIADIHMFTQELGENLGAIEGEREFKATFIFNDLGYGLKTDSEIEMVAYYGGLHEESFKVIGIQE